MVSTESDPFAGPQEDQGPPKPFVLGQFNIDKNLSGARLLAAVSFQTLAEQLVEHVPEGTLRTSLLERLVDTRGAVLRALPLESRASER